VVAVQRDARGAKRVMAVGQQGKEMLGRTPGNIEAVRPLRDGVIADFEITEHVSAFFIHWLDLAAPVAIGGLWLWLFFVNLRSRPLLPVRDPYLQDALQSSGGH
jgi:hypothetical protein